ncbi:MAG: hypothetical protein PHU14_12210 [Methylovulum sp.]|nr:hypothetical protein [Methylovulum sp.]
MTFFSNRHKTPSLSAQIRATERRLSNRHQSIGNHTATLSQKIKHQLSNPPNLFLASGIGFIIGEFTKHPQATDGKHDNGATTTRSPLEIALNLFSSIHTLYTALPLVWMTASAYQSKPPR